MFGSRENMLDIGDPAIKLFGKTIPVLSSSSSDELPVAVSGEDAGGESNCNSDPEQIIEDAEREAEKEPSQEKSTETVHQDDPSSPDKEDSTNQQTTSTQDVEKDSLEGETPKDEKESGESKSSQEKTLKKPDKILPCPRCNSMDTKFCYYNNYNVNQPRHFCKSCQRYWTAGGAMRNVPVGAGRRKNKNSASRYCQITVSEALQAARIDIPNGVNHPALKANGTVLTFGSDAPLCESMASVLNLAEKKALYGTRNGLHKVERIIPVPVPCRSRENGDDYSSGSTVTTSSMEDGIRKVPKESIAQSMNGFINQIPCFPGVHWPYAWNAAFPVPTFCPSGFPLSFYPAPYMNGTTAWNIPWVSTGQKGLNSNTNPPTLGKHPREEDNLKSSDGERKSGTPVLVPKTLRMDDPDEAAKSSIWTTLGIKQEKVNSFRSGGFFKGFQTKNEEKNHKLESSPALKANPAALCRSVSFHERA
ncbi:hypothetical protein Ancab_038876 [Ancistrocladus abbreviatus]